MLVSVLLFLAILYFLYYSFVGRRKSYPPGPIPLPLLGNVLQLFSKNAMEKKFIDLSKIYGPVYTVWLGNDPSVVITDLELIREALLKQGEAFSGRPYNYIQNDVFRGGVYGIMMNDGPVWKAQRRFSLRVLRDFGFGRQLMERKVMAEVQKLVKTLEDKANVECGIDISGDMRITAANIISSLMMGHIADEDIQGLLSMLDAIQNAATTAATVIAFFLLGSVPSLRHIPLFGHFGYDMIVQVRDGFLGYCKQCVIEHKETYNPEDEPSDYIAAFLKEMNRREQAGEPLESFTERQLYAALFDIWIAGMETTRLTFSWGMLLMVLHPEVQEKCYEEIYAVISQRDSDNEIKMADRSACPFLAATVTEIQRFANIVPLNVPHKTTQDVVVNGHVIKKGTTVLPQISSVLLDEKLFPSPEQFNPGRFVEINGTSLKKESMDNVVAFSMGKRACLGESLARMELFLSFSTLIQHFKFSLPIGEKPPSMESKIPTGRLPHDYKVVISLR